jgi:UDP-N-acetylmuramoyl-L-alanyl-D-glutamate--2,6-diaminopimelate ligase
MSGLSKILKNKFHMLQALSANLYYAFPQRKLKLLGVTGTDGKTTTTQMIYHIMKENGFNVAYLSTISAKIGDKELDTGFHVTTPDPWMVPRYLKMMVDAKAEYVIIEATSQGLAQNRLWGLTFEAAAITNIRSDHLDYHGTWKEYAMAKAKLLEQVKEGGVAVLNKDDAKSADFFEHFLIDILPEELKQIWYSKNDLSSVDKNFKGLKFVYESQEFSLPVIGSYNLENALAAINICRKYLPLNKIAKALESFPAPTGRMQVVTNEPFTYIIDFAHTPHALSAALDSLKEIQSEGRIITVFGCAGKRDKKRREMGQIASTKANIIILTAEDPRDEQLANINDEIIEYALKENAKLLIRFKDHDDYATCELEKLKQDTVKLIEKGIVPIIAFDEDSVQSRKDAIDLSLNIAAPNDIVFLTGKAHERSLAFGNKEFDWNELVECEKALKNYNS